MRALCTGFLFRIVMLHWFTMQLRNSKIQKNRHGLQTGLISGSIGCLMATLASGKEWRVMLICCHWKYALKCKFNFSSRRLNFRKSANSTSLVALFLLYRHNVSLCIEMAMKCYELTYFLPFVAFLNWVMFASFSSKSYCFISRREYIPCGRIRWTKVEVDGCLIWTSVNAYMILITCGSRR